MRQKKALILFTKAPVAGETKTRLMPYFSKGECALLHSCMLTDIRRECKKTGADLRIYYAPEQGKSPLVSIFGKKQVYEPQRGASLGERMKNAIQETLCLGYTSCLLFGSDIPALRAEDFSLAFRILEEKSLVFGPSADGGYYLVGMKSFLPEVFEHKTYSHGRVLEETLEDLKNRGLTYGLLRTLRDIDEKEDIAWYREYARNHPAFRRTATGRCLRDTLKISVIIPIYNESSTVKSLQRQLWNIRKDCEIIFVDGGSTDDTLKKIHPSFSVLSTEKGRAVQMNEGAKKSSGDVLFFLHSDSRLPKDFLREIRRVMAYSRAGCFGIAFHSRNFFMWTCRVISNHRVIDRRVMFGDQGIFVDRELFFRAGMFPELPIMEDYQFSLTLKSMGVRPALAAKRIYTSDRRFPPGTLPKLELMWKMNRLRKMYRDGMEIEKIAALYRDVR